MERRERAALDDAGTSGRPTRRFVSAMGDLLESLDRSPTPCEMCDSAFASTVTGTEGRWMVICRYCSERRRRATPIERRQMQIDVARRQR
jgi:hypothetical protein